MKTNNRLLKLSGMCLAMLWLVNISIAQDNTLPQTPVGKIASAYFAAFNAEDEAEMREFTANYRTQNALNRIPLESRMAQHNQIKGMLKSLKPRKVMESKDNHLVVLVYSEEIQSWFETSFTINDQDPPKLENFGLKPAESPEESADEGFGEWSNLEELLKSVADKHGIPGLSMAVIKDGRVADKAVAGVREAGTNNRLSTSDKFHIGSITKSMTATIIGKLVEDGKLTPETTIKQVFPTIEMLEAYETVTVQQLLTHTAGIPPYLTASEEEEKRLANLPGNPTQQRIAFIKQVLMETPTSKPGTTFGYSNAGYSILGAIAEKAGGAPWFKQLQTTIFEPLKMNTAGEGWPRTPGRQDQPVGHFGELSDLEPHETQEYELTAHIDPAGDIHSSMEDLAKYALAHMNGVNGKDGILKHDTFNWLHTPSPKYGYAAGWFVTQSDEGKTVHEHAGSAGTFLAILMIEPETEQGWVISANAGGIVLDGLFRRVIKEYRSK